MDYTKALQSLLKANEIGDKASRRTHHRPYWYRKKIMVMMKHIDDALDEIRVFRALKPFEDAIDGLKRGE